MFFLDFPVFSDFPVLQLYIDIVYFFSYNDILTLGTKILDFLLSCFNVSLQILFVFVHRKYKNCFYMSLQTTLTWCFIFTLITGIFDFLMECFNVILQISICCIFSLTSITRILDFFMNCLNMFFEISCCCLIFTLTSILSFRLV